MDIISTLGLNLDPQRPIHYLIGVAVYSHPRSEKRGELYLKYGPIVFNNMDVANLKLALETHKGELIKTSLKESLNIFDVSSMVSMIGGFRMACAVNQCTMHHFSSHEAHDDDFFEHFIDLANKSEGILKKLQDAEVR